MKNSVLKYLQLGLINIANVMSYFIILVAILNVIHKNGFIFDNIMYILISVVVITCLIYVKENLNYICKTR